MSIEIWDDNRITDKVLKLGDLWFGRVEPRYKLKVVNAYRNRKLVLEGRYDIDVVEFMKKIGDHYDKSIRDKIIRQRINRIDTSDKFMIFSYFGKPSVILVKNDYLSWIKFRCLERNIDDVALYTIHLLDKDYGAVKIVGKGPFVSATYKDYTALFFVCFNTDNITISGLV